MEQYNIKLEGLTPLLMHNDNLAFGESIKEWQNQPENKALSKAGDDRSPAWTWIGYLYSDGEVVGIPSDNLMTMLREGGVKVRTGKGQETFKKQTQAGIMVDQQQFQFFNNGVEIPMQDIKTLLGNANFVDHIKTAEDLGFELNVKRAKIGRSKHVRVRPMFRSWVARGSVTVLDEELSGITEQILSLILNQCGALIGLCDWRPGSPAAPGSFGKFQPTIERA